MVRGVPPPVVAVGEGRERLDRDLGRDERVVDAPPVDQPREVGEARLRAVPEVGDGGGVAEREPVVRGRVGGDPGWITGVSGRITGVGFGIVAAEYPMRVGSRRAVQIAREDDRNPLAAVVRASPRQRRESRAEQARGLAARASANVVEVRVDDEQFGGVAVSGDPRPRRDPRMCRVPIRRRLRGGLREPERAVVDDLPPVGVDRDRTPLSAAARLAAAADELVAGKPIAEVAALLRHRLLKGGDVRAMEPNEPPDGVSAVVPRVVVVAAVGVADVVAQHPDIGHYEGARSRAD